MLLTACEALEIRRQLAEVNFQIPALSPAESAGTVNLNVNLSAVSASDVLVPFSLGGTASDPGDYSISQSPLVIPAGASSAAIAVTIVNDTLDEPNETVVITLGTPTGATLGANSVHTLTIADNDLAPTVRFDATVNSASEGAGTFAPKVLLSAASGFQVTVPIQLSTGGTATSPADYTFTAGSVVIPAGELSGTVNVLNLVDDQIVEATETVNLTLGTPTNGTTASPTSLTVNITDNDAAPAVNASSFEFLSAPQRVVFQFSKNVSASLSVADLLVKNLNTESYIPAAAIALNYDTATNTATFTFPGLPNGALPDGNYRARLSRFGITDSLGNAMQADGVVGFYALNGDANRDRAVDINDFSLLAANFNQPGDYSAADLTYDGIVNISDFSILASQFNKTRPAPVAPARYTYVRVPNPADGGGFNFSRMNVSVMNDNGKIAGNWTFSIGSSSGTRIYSWSPGDTNITPGEYDYFPNGINNAGDIVGQRTVGLSQRAFGPDGDLDHPVGGNYAAFDINDLGNIVGIDILKGVRWLGGIGTYEVVVPANSSLQGINNLGAMVGWAGDNAIYIPSGSTTPTVIATDAQASDINEVGKVLGRYDHAPFTWSPGKAAFELEPLGQSSAALSINNAGLAVGLDNDEAVIWYEGLPYNLETLIDGVPLTLTSASAINNNGQIAAAFSAGNATGVYILTPIPGSGPAAPPIATRSADNEGEIEVMIDPPQPQRAMAATSKALSSPTFSNDLIERLSDVL